MTELKQVQAQSQIRIYHNKKPLPVAVVYTSELETSPLFEASVGGDGNQ
jgi:hypothetical protein